MSVQPVSTSARNVTPLGSFPVMDKAANTGTIIEFPVETDLSEGNHGRANALLVPPKGWMRVSSRLPLHFDQYVYGQQTTVAVQAQWHRINGAWHMGGLELSPQLRPFEEEIRFSHELIGDATMPDGQPYDEPTWQRAIQTADYGLAALSANHLARIRSLEISWAPAANIDMVFYSADRELAINVAPGSRDLFFNFSGQSLAFRAKSGALGPTETLTNLLRWLTDPSSYDPGDETL